MENTNSYTDIGIVENIYENFAEDRIEQEIAIPDYQPSARKIVECSAEAAVLNKSTTNDSVTLDGVCSWDVIYLSDEDEALHAITCERPFSISFAVGQMRGNVKYKVRTQNTICKLHSSQKATCKTTVCVAIKIEDRKNVQTLAGVGDEDVELRADRKNVLEPLDRCEKEFKIVSEMPMRQNTDVTVCRCTAEIVVGDTKCDEDKIRITGVCRSKVILLDQRKCRASALEGETPFTQLIDAPGVSAACFANVSCVPVEKDATIMDENGEKSVLFTVTVQANAAVYCPREVDLYVDAFHPKYILDTQRTAPEICCDLFSVELSDRINEKIHLNTRGIDVLYTESAARIEKIAAHENTLVLEGNAVVGFTYAADGDVTHSEYTLPFQTTKTLDRKFCQLRCEAEVYTPDPGFIILSDTEIEVDLNCRICLNVFDMQSADVISDIKLLDDPQEQTLRTPLVLYYGTKGETVWEIAKKYLVPVNAVMSANDLAGDVLEEDKMLFIGRH